jgi:hypothetical protein
MIEWMAVINTVSIQLHELPQNEQKDMEQVLAEIFFREYEPLLAALQNDSGQVNVPPFVDKQVPVIPAEARSLFRTNSVCEDGSLAVQYQVPDNGVKNPFQFSGITVDKLIERLSDLYSPDPDFQMLIVYCYRAFLSPESLLQKCKSRLNPLFTQQEASYVQWKHIVRLRYRKFK